MLRIGQNVVKEDLVNNSGTSINLKNNLAIVTKYILH